MWVYSLRCLDIWIPSLSLFSYYHTNLLVFSPSSVVPTDPSATQTEHTSEILPYLTPAQATSRAVKRLAPYIESAIVERKVALGIPLSTPEVQSLGTEAENLRRIPLHSSDERIQTRKREYYEWRPHLDPPDPRPNGYLVTLRGPGGLIKFFSNWKLQRKHPLKGQMDDYGSETDSDYTTYWRDWVGSTFLVYVR